MMKTFEKVIEIKVCTGQIYCFQFKVKYTQRQGLVSQRTIKVELEANHMGHANMNFKTEFECLESVFTAFFNQEIEKMKHDITSTLEKRFFPDLNEFDKQLYQLGFKKA